MADDFLLLGRWLQLALGLWSGQIARARQGELSMQLFDGRRNWGQSWRL